MAVRFLPSHGDHEQAQPEDRKNLAEVIELRSRLPQQGWYTGPAAGSRGPDIEGHGSVTRADDPGATEDQSVAADSSPAMQDSRPVSDAVVTAFERRRSAASVENDDGSAPDPERARKSNSVPEDGTTSDAEPSFERGFDPALEAGLLASDSAGEEARQSPSAYEDGVRVMARKARSSGELRSELLAREHEPFEVEAVVEEFVRSHYLDDLGLARVTSENLRERKRASRSQIRMKLRERKLPDDVIEAALSELDEGDEIELLRQTARDRARRLGDLDRATAERRLLGFLARRGWSGEPAMRAVRDALDGRHQRSGGGVRFE